MNRLPSHVHEAIKIYHCFFGGSHKDVADVFGCGNTTVYNIINNIHRIKPKTNTLQWKRAGQEKRNLILELLKKQPLSIDEIQAAIGSNPDAYLTKLRKAGKIDRKCVWVLK